MPEENEAFEQIQAHEDGNSPLTDLLVEVHELYGGLVEVGFPERAAVQIVAHILHDSMMYRTTEDEEDDEEYDPDE